MTTSHDPVPLDSRISAVVLTRDEARHIVPCLRTLQWADEQLVVDSRSSDATADLAATMGARVVVLPWDNFAGQRNFALEQARSRWVLFVDADERVPLELADEIREAVAESVAGGARTPVGYWVPRQNLILGHWVRHVGWHPDYQLRLFRVAAGRYDPLQPVHELVLLDGPAARLKTPLVHHNYVSWRQFWAKQRAYARMEAAQLHGNGQRAKARNFVLQPLRELRRRYVSLEGYREGAIGLQLSLVLAAANFTMYRDLWRVGRGVRSARAVQEQG